jgi:transcriptional regulator with XRE-family HTH domain
VNEKLDIESMRATLKALKRSEVLDIAAKAGIKPSTLSKFRSNHITDPSASKLVALHAELMKRARKSRKER